MLYNMINLINGVGIAAFSDPLLKLKSEVVEICMKDMKQEK